MNFAQAVNTGLSKYVDFSGRASRSEYWFFFLFVLLVSFVAGLIDGLTAENPNDMGILGAIVSLVFLLPNISIATRRLHDVGRSGWWQLLYLTIIGIFVVLFWLCTKSDPGSNQYGEPETQDDTIAYKQVGHDSHMENDLKTKLLNAKSMLDDNLITEEEYASLKAKILSD